MNGRAIPGWGLYMMCIASIIGSWFTFKAIRANGWSLR